VAEARGGSEGEGRGWDGRGEERRGWDIFKQQLSLSWQ